MGVSTGEATVYHDKGDGHPSPGQVFGQIHGIATQDPAFGLGGGLGRQGSGLPGADSGLPWSMRPPWWPPT